MGYQMKDFQGLVDNGGKTYIECKKQISYLPNEKESLNSGRTCLGL